MCVCVYVYAYLGSIQIVYEYSYYRMSNYKYDIYIIIYRL